MKSLPPGTPKYLFIAPEEVARNFERQTTSDPVARVGEPDPVLGMRFHEGYGVAVDGPVVLDYRQTGEIAVTRDRYNGVETTHRAVYVTNGRVLIAESPEEAETLLQQTTALPPEVEADIPEPNLDPVKKIPSKKTVEVKR